MTKILNLPKNTLKLILASFILLLFFLNTVSAQAASGWFFPRFEYVDNALPSECSAGDMAIDFHLVDLDGNTVSSNGGWGVTVDSRPPINFSQNVNHSGFVCLKPNSKVKIQVSRNSAFEEFQSPIIELAEDGVDIPSLVGTRFKGFVQLTPNMHGDDDTVMAIGLDSNRYTYGTSKFLIKTNHITDSAMNGGISANLVEKTTVRILNLTSNFDRSYDYSGPADDSQVYSYAVPDITNSGDGTFFWAVIQNLDGEIKEQGTTYGWTFSNNPFSSLSETNHFFNDTTPPKISLYSSDNPDTYTGATAVPDTTSGIVGASTLLMPVHFSDGQSLSEVYIRVYDEDGNEVGKCEKTFPEEVDADGNPAGTTGVSSVLWVYDNSCTVDGVMPGNIKIKIGAVDFFGNIIELERGFFIDPNLDIPELGLKNIDSEGNTLQPPYIKHAWSSYELYAHVKDLHNSPIPKTPGSNDATTNLGFCFSLDKDRDFKKGEAGVTCISNGGLNSVSLSATMPFNFARKFNFGSSLNKPVDFTTIKIDGVPILQSEEDKITIYFRAYGINAAGIGYSEIVAIEDVSTAFDHDEDLVVPTVKFLSSTNNRADNFMIGVNKISLGYDKEIYDWGVCFAEDEAGIDWIEANIDAILANDNFVDGKSIADGKGRSGASYKFRSPNGNNGYRDDGQLAISDYGYESPTCKISGPDISQSSSLGRWDINSETMRTLTPDAANHIFLSTSLTTESEMKINPGSEITPKTTYYGIAFAKNLVGFGFDRGTFETDSYKYGFAFNTYGNKPKVEVDDDTYDDDLNKYTSSKAYFYVNDRSSAATPTGGREVRYDIEITRDDGSLVKNLNGTALTFRNNPENIDGSYYNDTKMNVIDLGELKIGRYTAKITINNDGAYSPFTKIDEWKPVYIINNFEIKAPLGFDDTTTSGSTEDSELNIDPNLTLTAEPNLVRAGQSTKIKWEMDNVGPDMRCTIQGPSTFGTNGKEEFNHKYDETKDKTDRILGEIDSGAVNNTQIYTFSCANTIETYTTTARVNVVGTQQEI